MIRYDGFGAQMITAHWLQTLKAKIRKRYYYRHKICLSLYYGNIDGKTKNIYILGFFALSNVYYCVSHNKSTR